MASWTEGDKGGGRSRDRRRSRKRWRSRRRRRRKRSKNERYIKRNQTWSERRLYTYETMLKGVERRQKDLIRIKRNDELNLLRPAPNLKARKNLSKFRASPGELSRTVLTHQYRAAAQKLCLLTALTPSWAWPRGRRAGEGPWHHSITLTINPRSSSRFTSHGGDVVRVYSFVSMNGRVSSLSPLLSALSRRQKGAQFSVKEGKRRRKEGGSNVLVKSQKKRSDKSRQIDRYCCCRCGWRGLEELHYSFQYRCRG